MLMSVYTYTSDGMLLSLCDFLMYIYFIFSFILNSLPNFLLAYNIYTQSNLPLSEIYILFIIHAYLRTSQASSSEQTNQSSILIVKERFLSLICARIYRAANTSAAWGMNESVCSSSTHNTLLLVQLKLRNIRQINNNKY